MNLAAEIIVGYVEIRAPDTLEPKTFAARVKGQDQSTVITNLTGNSHLCINLIIWFFILGNKASAIAQVK
jgi:hypothetical protein